jgi:membrane fusion protein, multidrug efflux system
MSEALTLPLPGKPATLRRQRKRAFIVLGSAIAVVAIGAGAWYFIYASHHVSTDNAYVAAETAQVTAAVSGIVAEVDAVDTRRVRKGDVLVRIDPTDARLALAQAVADQDSAERRVRAYFANDENLAATLQAREADLQRARQEFARRNALAGNGGVTGEELSNARAGVESATAARNAAEAALRANQALTQHSTVDTNPEVQLARARVEQARIDLARTEIRAPVDGVVARRQVQIGQRVQPGAVLMSVVPVDTVHVDANFKEVQLDKVRIGQPVELEADLYGSAVTYHGRVAGLSGGSGAAFSMIPAQNATGNWIKVVQRLPVRIELDRAELAAHPLKVGLSMTATIDTAEHSRNR